MHADANRDCDRREQRVLRWAWLRWGLIGAGVTTGLHLAGGILHTILRGTSACVLIQKPFFLVNYPCVRLIPRLLTAGLIDKHDGFAVVAVFFIYSAMLGFVLGTGVSLLLGYLRSVQGRKP